MKPKNEQEFNLIRREVGVFSRNTYNDAIEKIRKKFSHLDPPLLEMLIAEMAIVNSRVSLIYYLLQCKPSERKREFDFFMANYEKSTFEGIAQVEKEI